MTKEHARSLVLFSGGLDSTTCLYIARRRSEHTIALSFDYGQRHSDELIAADNIIGETPDVRHVTQSIDWQVGGSALTDGEIKVPLDRVVDDSVPATYVPARNTIFLAYALSYAEAYECDAIYIGVNALDYSGYPDCRPAFIHAFQELARVATVRAAPEIVTPLLHLHKSDIVQLAQRYEVPLWMTVSCYLSSFDGGVVTSCGRCDACQLRRAGFAGAQIPDPTPYR